MDVNSQLTDTFFKISRLMKEEMGFSSDFCKLSILQIQALVFLKKHPQSQMTEIAANFKVELPSATSLINGLVKLKFVERKPDKKDRRLVRISLTKSGNFFLTDAMKARSERMKKHLSYLSLEDKKSLLDILQRLTAKLEKSHEK